MTFDERLASDLATLPGFRWETGMLWATGPDVPMEGWFDGTRPWEGVCAPPVPVLEDAATGGVLLVWLMRMDLCPEVQCDRTRWIVGFPDSLVRHAGDTLAKACARALIRIGRATSHQGLFMTPVERAQLKSIRQSLGQVNEPSSEVVGSIAVLDTMLAEPTVAHMKVWVTAWTGENTGKVWLIKAIREITCLGLAEAKHCVESLPQCLGTFPVDHPGIAKLRDAGATVELSLVEPTAPFTHGSF